MNQAASPRPNRRRGCRLKAKPSIRIDLTKGGFGRSLARSILDISQTGVRLVVKEPLAANQEVLVELECMNHRGPIKSRGRVIWCQCLADGTHCVGVDFASPISHYDFIQLIIS
jgi:PilZ domain